MGEQTYKVTGMSCGGCESAVENALADLSGIRDVDAERETDRVTVVSDREVGDEEIRSRIVAAGYEAS